jgi:hypothetical protein
MEAWKEAAMLFSRRKRQQDLAKQEAEGSTFWSADFSEEARTRIFLYYQDSAADYLQPGLIDARAAILRDEGRLYLHGPHDDPAEDMVRHLLTCDSQSVPTAIEALHNSLRERAGYPRAPYGAHAHFTAHVAVVLREHRVAFELINGQLIEFTSLELHSGVVSPTLTLLAGRAEWIKAEKAYQDALSEISRGKAADAITDAGTALEETLKLLGCAGTALGQLIKSARAKGLLAPHDDKLTGSLELAMSWVAVERNERGDAHHADERSIDDAWLIVHVVGALILRLAMADRH